MEKQILENNVIKPELSIFFNENSYRLISTQAEYDLDTKISELESYMRSNHGRGKSETEKDDLYGKSQELWHQYAQLLRDVHFTMYLNRKQYQFLTDLLTTKMEYDVNTVFVAIELTDMLGEWHSEGVLKDDVTLKGYTADSTEITYIYHLISKHKVKGLGNPAYRFAEVLKRIAQISKIIAYYDTIAKSLSKEIMDWVATFEEGVSVDDKDFLNTFPENILPTTSETSPAVKKTSRKKSIEEKTT
jgi:hypothetical protein